MNFHFASYGENEVSLGWNIPHNRGITSYRLERYDHDGAEFTASELRLPAALVSGGDSVTEPSAGLTADTLYRYDLTLRSDDGTAIIGEVA